MKSMVTQPHNPISKEVQDTWGGLDPNSRKNLPK